MTPFFDRRDAVGRRVTLQVPPRRIVSLVPSQTELLADLGLGDAVVGLTRFCVRPEGWKASKAIVGGTKNVAPAKVQALAPDLVIANKEENVKEQVEALDAPVWTTDVATVADTVDMIRTVGDLTDRRAVADRIADGVADGFDALPDWPPVRALYLIWRDPWMTVGTDTIIDDVMRRGGFENVCRYTRYPVLGDVELGALAPDVVLLSSEPYPFADKHVAEVQALVPGAAVVLADGEAFSWYGSRLLRTPDVLRDLRRRLVADELGGTAHGRPV